MPIDIPDLPPDDDGGDSSGGGGDSGGDSGGSSSPPAPKLDLYISDQFKQDAVARQKMQTFAALYQQLWGEPATEAYLAEAVKAGMNIWEFEEHERLKPAFRKTGTYKDQATSLADMLRQLGVV